MNKTVYEEGFDVGFAIGFARGLRGVIQRVLQKRFGPLSPAALLWIADYPADRLEALADSVWIAQSLKELGLED